MNETELNRKLAGWRAQISRDVELAIDAAAAELRDDLHTAIAEVNTRLDTVHREALRALTDAVKKGT